MSEVCSFPWYRLGVTGESCYACCISPFSSVTSFDIRGEYIEHGPRHLSLLWNSPSYQNMRRMMSDEGLESTCKMPGCPWVMGDIPAFLPADDLSETQIANREAAERSHRDREIIVQHHPVEIEMVLDTFCNLRCIHCSQRNERDSGKLLELGVESFADDLVEFLAHAERLILLGGEPTVSPTFDFVMDRVEEAAGARVQLVTNGQLIEREVLPRLSSIQWFHISVDAATEETYRKIRRGGSWNNLLRGLQALAAAAGDREILFHNVIHHINVHEMVDMVDFAAAHAGRVVRFDGVRPFASLTPQQVSSLTFTTRDELTMLRDGIDRARQRAGELGLLALFGNLTEIAGE